MKNTKGITLIALVVTIIVLLILAGVSISLLSGGDGIMAKAQSAITKNNETEAKERVALRIAEYQTDYYRAVYVEKTVSVSTEMGDWIALTNKGKTINAGDYEFEITRDSSPYKITILKNNRIKENIEGEMSAIGKVTWKVTTQGDSDGSGEDEEVTPAVLYKVKYDANGGYGNVPADAEYKDGDTVDVDLITVPAHAQGTFLGWATSKNASVPDYTNLGTDEFIMGEADVTLYAVYEYTQAYHSEHPELHIPTGFAYKEGTVATGYVITDAANPTEDGNEFVWVPVASSSDYAKKIGTHNYSLATAQQAEEASVFNGDISLAIKGDILGVSEILGEQVTSTLDANLPEADLVNNAGGFWVGRYEAGIANAQHGYIGDIEYWTSDATGISAVNDYWEQRKDNIIVKQNSEPVRNITQEKALSIANSWRNGAAGNGTVAFQSGLITGAQWDTMCNFIGWNIADGDCSAWGNYSNTVSSIYSGYHSTGSKSDWLTENDVIKEVAEDEDADGTLDFENKWIFPTGKFVSSNNGTTAQKNIYDIAGNVLEWSTEVPKVRDGFSVLRGGSVNYLGDHDNATFRHGGRASANLASWNIGFRIVLYVE